LVFFVWLRVFVFSWLHLFYVASCIPLLVALHASP